MCMLGEGEGRALISGFAPVSISPGLRLTSSSLFCRTAAFFSATEQHKHSWKLAQRVSGKKWETVSKSMLRSSPSSSWSPKTQEETRVCLTAHLQGASASHFSFSSTSMAWRCVPGSPACCCVWQEACGFLRPGNQSAAPSAGPLHLRQKAAILKQDADKTIKGFSKPSQLL